MTHDGAVALRADRVGKRYGHTWGLRDCTFAVPAGSVVGLVGPNCAGKTTLLALTVGLLARDVMAKPWTAALVTVSACRSAGGKTYAGEGMVGFAWTFLKAGAGNVIAGLWDVNDRSTTELMADEFSRLGLKVWSSSMTAFLRLNVCGPVPGEAGLSRP